MKCNHYCVKSSTGEARCTCKSGYELWHDSKSCVDIDECSARRDDWVNPCGINSKCTNIPGSYKCKNESFLPRRSCSYDKYYRSEDCCQKSTNTCGKVPPPKMSGRIVNGVRITEEDFPWMAHLYVSSSSGNVAGCGGTFIADNYVVTAFHCVYDHLSSSQWSRLTIMAGVESGYGEGAVSSSGKRPQEYKVIGVNAPKGASKGRYEQSDIAILKVQKKNERADSFQTTPICLPGGEAPKVGRNCFVIGYGATQYQGRPTMTLMEAATPIVDDDTCERQYSGYNMPERFNGAVQMCAGYLNGYQDACQGDSGGPLMCQRENSCEWYLAGVVSYGWRCGISYGVYAEVDYFSDWIHDITGIPKVDPVPPPCEVPYGEQGCEALKFKDKLYKYNESSDSYVLFDGTDSDPPCETRQSSWI
ncbi:unnamed protein product [Oikopleura dioica]|uniref:Peptidase S1 domain-containing protein n=1 Tax=Oikopleura dioica TaxID=34765 RepID=E4Y1M1_OIKDI|nr:unnamed protein product [Oikopleura dioica]